MKHLLIALSYKVKVKMPVQDKVRSSRSNALPQTSDLIPIGRFLVV